MKARPVIRCEGKGAERGETHGTQLRELVHDNIETYRRLLHRRFGLEWADARRRVSRFVAPIEAWDADLLAELRGIAAGAGVDLLDIVLLNARSSITLTGAAAHECTALASVPAEGAEGGAVLAQNWDNLRRLREVVLDVAAPGAPRCLTLTEAGTLAKIGLNGEGVGVCVNGLHAPGEVPDAVPIFVVLRKVLQARTLVEALRALTGTRRDAPHNYLLASTDGAAADVEGLTRDFEVLTPRGPFLVHTNHFVGPRLAACDDHRPADPGSVLRHWRAEALLRRHRGPFGPEAALAVLSDHLNAPASICAHAAPAPDGEDDLLGETRCAVVMELDARRLHVTAGHPCRGEVETLTLS